MLSYNGSTWLSIAITSIFLVGNKVRVKFSSKGAGLSELMESIYEPIFGNDVSFTRESGRQFLKNSLRDPNVSAIVVFGHDGTVMPYEQAVRESGKKLIFEGPGQDPFIVFPDADLELALSDLMVSKFLYSGQACIAPKRIFIHQSIYESFLDNFKERVSRLVVGDPDDEETDISPVASSLAVDRIREQLKEAVKRGAKIVSGGKIEGNLIYPTIIRDATDEMLGMREEVFGPVAFVTAFETKKEVIRRAKNHKYGLRAAIFGGKDAEETARALVGERYCHPVLDYTFGKFGTVALNETRSASWEGAFVKKPVGGYGRSGWIWETIGGRFTIKQGPKLLSLETSIEL
jgi:succinate-semialdehyde dehydrogenase/glutarate-semialdehyde dehydrogenase